ncbi:MAG: hypothetical protein WD749_05140 [Phycisphaerales bacterium]
MPARTLAALAFLITAPGCGLSATDPPGTGPSRPQGPPSTPRPEDAGPGVARAPTFTERALDAAATYKTWMRVSDMANWAPTMCDLPVPAGVQMSQSKDRDTHGRKLYFLFAKDATAYTSLGPPSDDATKAPAGPIRNVGQVIVKESWTQIEVDPATIPPVPKRAEERRARSVPPEYIFGPDGKAYRTDTLAGLFVMLKLDPKTPDTDDGWVYATLSPENRVTSVGKITSCMECHVKATHDRQFGLPFARPAQEKPVVVPPWDK